jgi:phosphoribosylformylglycinamidine cyclo-ligase
MKKGLTYKEAGVDIERGEELVKRIKSLAKSASRPEVLAGIGGFGGLFRSPARKYKAPVLVAGTDSVGTKIKVANLLKRFDTVGIDLVAMCVNDLITSGAEPLFFLDYLGLSKLEPTWAEEVIRGIARGCRMANCALLGGETAELPGIYPKGEWDLVGFAVGIVDKGKIIDGSKIKVGDKVIGLASSGLHSNGYSLVRKLFLKKGGELKSLKKKIKVLGRKLGEELLKPTKIYVKPVLKIIREFKVKGIAHITGGGFPGNIPRILPRETRAKIEEGSWKIPPIFNLVQEEGRIEKGEMFRTFNMGIGMTLIVPPKETERILRRLNRLGEKAYLIGEVRKGKKGVEIS